MSDTIEKKTIALESYDAYGFDLDHTLAKYNLVEQIKLSYKSVVSYLVEEKGYRRDIWSEDIAEHKDFIVKGLFVDTFKGNILKLSHSGKILKGSHGTRMLSREELVATYGEDLQWEHYQLARDAVRPRAGDESFVFWENYFDMPAFLICGQLVDYLDKQNGGPLEDYREMLFGHVPAGLTTNYRFEAFADDSGKFFPGVKKDPGKFYSPCSEGVKHWLRDLKKGDKCVFLITSSHIDFAELTASQVLGPEWKSYFDIIITNARKPGFFKEENPFLSLDGIHECETMDWSDLKQHEVYSSGNHRHLERFISKVTGQQHPKVVYFGDSLCSDAFPVKTLTCWDMILVLEEMEAEGYHPHDRTHHYWEPEEKQRKIVRKVNLAVSEEEEAYLLSSQWGSFFYQPPTPGDPAQDPTHHRHMNTFWGELITKYADIAIPSVEYIAGLPLDHKFTMFDHSDDGNTDGFSPAKPKPLLPLETGSQTKPELETSV